MQKFANFNQGVIPTIACFNKATTPLGIDLDVLISAMQSYVTNHITPVWGTPAKLIRSSDFVKDAWAIVFLDDADQPGALAYHELTPKGLPLAKVFVRAILDYGEPVSVSASHELVEMLVDPAINIYSTGPDILPVYAYADSYPLQTVPVELDRIHVWYAYESADPVEEETFKVDGIDMSDFVYPAYFENFRAPGSVQFDHESKVAHPFQLLPGGSHIIFTDGSFCNVFGSEAKARRFAQQDRRGHRSEARTASKLRRARRLTLRQHGLLTKS